MSFDSRSIDPELLRIVVCPACHGEVREAEGLECTSCGRIYPVRDGIPVLLVEEAGTPTCEADPASDEE